jgi:hypothetical protein
MPQLDDRLNDLLLQWEDQRARGQPASPAELCRDRPELTPWLESQLAAIGQMDRLAEGARDTPVPLQAETISYRSASPLS